MSVRHRSSSPQPHPAVLPHLRHFETPDMAQSGGCPQEALGTSWDTATDCGLRLTHRTEDLAWPGTQKKKKKNMVRLMYVKSLFHQKVVKDGGNHPRNGGVELVISVISSAKWYGYPKAMAGGDLSLNCPVTARTMQHEDFKSGSLILIHSSLEESNPHPRLWADWREVAWTASLPSPPR